MTSQKCFVLKSNYNEKYLEYVNEPEKIRGLNKFSGKNPVSLYGFYKIEKAKTGGGLVHIKCCYNNKYLVRCSPNDYWIASTADKPEEDKRKWSCTLFEILPIFFNTDIYVSTIRLRHVQLEHYASLWTHQVQCGVITPYDYCLSAESKEVDKDGRGVFTINVVHILNDGTYTGVDSCKFKYETKEEKLAAASNLIEQLASDPI